MDLERKGDLYFGASLMWFAAVLAAGFVFGGEVGFEILIASTFLVGAIIVAQALK